LWLSKRGKLEVNPFDLVEEPPHSRPLPRAPRAADLKKLFAVLEAGATLGKWNHIRDLALFGLLYDTGIRAGEATHLEMTDLNTQLCVATIRGTKTGEDRVVVFEAQTAGELRNWLKAREGVLASQSTVRLSAHAEALSLTSPFVFISSHHHAPLTVSGLRTNLRRWCQRANIPAIKPHALRHAYAIHTLRNGGDLLDVQRQLGHHNLATTQRYTLVTAAGRKQRHAQHSPRKNLANTAAGEDEA
jgi:integrase/recombinase XerD